MLGCMIVKAAEAQAKDCFVNRRKQQILAALASIQGLLCYELETGYDFKKSQHILIPPTVEGKILDDEQRQVICDTFKQYGWKAEFFSNGCLKLEP